MSNNPYANFKTSRNVEMEGVILEDPNFEVRIRRAGGANKAYEKQLEAALRPYRRSIDMGNVDNEQANKLLAPVFARTIIVSWAAKDAEGEMQDGMIHDPKTGELVEATQETIVEALNTFPELFSWIRTQASNTALFLDSVIEVDAKN